MRLCISASTMSSKHEPQGADIVLRSRTSSLKPRPDTCSTLKGSFQQESVPPTNADADSQMTVPILRSMSAMRGLLLAEVGDSMVEFDVYGKPGESGYRVGQRIAPGCLVPEGSSKFAPSPRKVLSAPDIVVGGTGNLPNSATFFDVNATPAKSSPEIKALLGNSNSKLKPRAIVPPRPGLRNADSSGDLGTDFKPIALEKAKWRTRVEVDIILENQACVQGGYLKGTVKIHIKKGSKKDAPLLLSQGKVRVVGFECIPQKDSKCTFYKCSALLSEIAPSWKGLFKSPPDDDGWAEAQEGVHVFPFAMLLPPDGGCGMAKGVLSMHSGVAIKYVAMAEIKVKDAVTSKQSIAHFYRDCEVWPRLDVISTLATNSRPLVAEVATRVFMGGPGKIRLSARIHRFHWVAGQRCTVHFRVTNDCKKLVKGAAIALIRTLTVFKPQPYLDAGDADPDACQTSTKAKWVTESVLELGQRCAKGHASAKGWWTGVAPGQTSEFDHSVIIPPDVHSIARTRLLEVEYTLRISVGIGRCSSDIHVILPIRIVNFLSLDPPPTPPLRTQSKQRPLPECAKREPWYRKSRIGNIVETDETVPGMKYTRDMTVATHPENTDDGPVFSGEQHQDPDVSADSASVYPPSQSESTIAHRENLLRSVSEEEIGQVLGTLSDTASFARGCMTTSSSAIEPHILARPRGPRSGTLSQLQPPQAESTPNTTFIARRIQEKLQSPGTSWVIVNPFIEHKSDVTKAQTSRISNFGSSSTILPRPPAMIDETAMRRPPSALLPGSRHV
ncbi:uncharacterized protein EDB91DRAFT_1276347 [Suillus paluster]|uniref:uncharacterized protein n=1 Tax=Suillus paluster TaxID=48578 RepID=UPI001B866A21|nr:uncharacterized protein EDB91DRAFT_1276347 [Suillus paluster]KAG1754874.1 hypothetical protein EDB91DRAFT_1276347 [Suillus paluster]